MYTRPQTPGQDQDQDEDVTLLESILMDALPSLNDNQLMELAQIFGVLYDAIQFTDSPTLGDAQDAMESIGALFVAERKRRAHAARVR